MSIRRTTLAAVAIVLAGGALRFATLGVQSLWLDESVTAGLVHHSFTSMLSAIPGSESTPPLYYVLLWPWVRVFGHGEAGLRSLSALAGTAGIGVAFLLGRRLAGPRAGLLAALLTAANPLLIWYSQEARAYALLALFSAVALLGFLDARERPDRRALGLWAVATGLALATHYFAVFPAAAEAAWLLHRHRRRVAVAVGAVGLVALTLVPLVVAQSSDSRAGFIAGSGLARRAVQIPKQFLIGYRAPGQALLGAAAILLALAGLALLARRRGDRAVVAVLVVVAGGVGVPLAAAAVGVDYVITRNLIAVLLPALVLIAAGWDTVARAAPAGAGALAALGVLTFVLVEHQPLDQRADAQGAARAVGAVGESTVLLGRRDDLQPVALYLSRAQVLPPGSVASVRDLTWVELRPMGGYTASRGATVPPTVPAAFRQTYVHDGRTYTLVRWQAAAPVPVTTGAFASAPGEGELGVLTVPPQRSGPG